jgi:hypothetical protein
VTDKQIINETDMRFCVKRYARQTLLLNLFALGLNPAVYSQTELEPWGNIIAIRTGGQPINVESSLRIANGDWSFLRATGQEKQRPEYKREGGRQIVTTAIDSIHFAETVEEAGKGAAKVNVQVSSSATRNSLASYFSLSLPAEYYAGGSMRADKKKPILLTDVFNSPQPVNRSVKFISPERSLEIVLSEPASVILRKETDKGITKMQVYLPLSPEGIGKEQAISKTFTIKVWGKIDKRPITLRLDTTAAGRAFEGLGGNFRLQNAKTDPQVIDYCLQNLRVAWGRVEMPWRFWQPELNSNPIDSARAGKLNSQVKHAMEMAQRLNKMGIPIILTTWSAPSWAIVGAPKFRPGPDGVWGNPLDHTKDAEIYKSIADYITCLKEQYGVEPRLFSFNESDLGINIRQTGAEHAALIKGLGAYLVSRGLKTKMLLGDNSDATTYQFIYPAMNDPATYPYIGAISFHSWRGWGTEILEKWADAAAKMNLPLLVAEGSIDAAAWNYPAIFEEPLYAMQEITLYTRLLAICQPESILQWQLTADYSPLAGGGIFGNDEPLHPTRRFWNLKQLSSTPAGLKWMKLSSDGSLLSCAALGDNQKKAYAIHLVNNGATRKVYLYGLPAKVNYLDIYVTGANQTMQAGRQILVKNGEAHFELESDSYTTLISE